jgi:peroxiredoxin (alkyl hydroperoxide reductase subunit C)
MSLVGRQAPDFTLEGYFNKNFETFKLSDYKGKWVYLLFYPLDFTFVCPTEVLAFSKMAEEFRKLNCAIFGVSIDSKFVHKAWVDSKREDGGLGGSLAYPLLADVTKKAAADYGILLEEGGVALRGLFLISPDGLVMQETVNNLSVGRSVKEALRQLRAFQYVTSHEGEVCPAEWDDGEDTMSASSKGMQEYLSSH